MWPKTDPEPSSDSSASSPGFTSQRRALLAAIAVACLVTLATIARSYPANTTVPRTMTAHRIEMRAPEVKQAARRFQHSPIDFEPNRGQVDAAARFLARGPGYTLFLTADEAVLALEKPRRRGVSTALSPRELRGATDRHVLQMKFEGANRAPRIDGIERRAAISNYFLGKDPAKWRTRIPHYARVRYRSIYRGIDLVYYGANNQLEYDLVVKPGADLGKVRFKISGADHLRIDSRGDVALAVGNDNLFVRKPVVYQEIGGRRRLVDGSYRMLGRATVGIEVADYDRSRPLIVDPALSYATFLGGSSIDAASAVAIDSNGNAYLTGLTCSNNFPTTAGVLGPTKGKAPCAAFVTKLDTSATPVYSTYLGGGDTEDPANGIAVDGSGFAYVVGQSGANFPTTAGVLETSIPTGASTNAFVAKLATDGSSLVYSTFLGGGTRQNGNIPVEDAGFAIALLPGCASNCNAFVGGRTDASDFNGTSNGFQPANGGTTAPFDGFVAQLNSGATALVYSSYLGGQGNDTVFGIAVDTAGEAFVTGVTDSSATPNFPTTMGAAQTTFGGTADAFVAKVSADGTSKLYSSLLGGSGYDAGTAIAVDTAGDAFVAGYTFSTDFPVSGGVVQPTFGRSGVNYALENGFIAELNPAGSSFLYQTYLGGITAGLFSLAIDSTGNAYVAGFSATPDFPTASQLFGPPAPSGEFLESSDAGSTFFRTTTLGSTVTSWAVDSSATPHTIYAGTISDGVLASTDDGATFHTSGLSGYVNGVLFDQSVSPSHLYAGTVSGLMLSTDGGATFSTTSLGSAPASPKFISIEPVLLFVSTGTSGMVRSTDSGVTFNAVAGLPGNTPVYSVAAGSQSPDTVFAGTNKGIFVSTDDGANFAATNVNFDAIFSIVVEGGVEFAAGQNSGLLESTDRFSTFTSPFPPNSGPSYALAVDSFLNPQSLYIANNVFGLLKSTDGGDTFSLIRALPFFAPIEFGSLGLDPPPPSAAALPSKLFTGLYLQSDAVIAQLNPAATTLLFSSYLGGTSADFGAGLAAASNGSAIFVSGATASGDFPATNGSTLSGTGDAFAARIALPTATATATTTATATVTATVTATATVAATATATATVAPTATPTATPTVAPTVAPTPTTTATVAPTPTTGGSISGPSPVNVTGVAGQNLDAGRFTLTSAQPVMEDLSTVTITVANPAILASLTLSAGVNGTTRSVTVAMPTSTTVFTFSPPLMIPPGGTVNFSLTAMIAKAGAAAAMQTSFGGFHSGGGLIDAVSRVARGASSMGGVTVVAAATVPMLLMMLLLPGTIRPRMIAAGIGALALIMPLAGCDPCPSCGPFFKSTAQSVTAVGVTTDSNQNQLPFTGLPHGLNRVTRKTP